MCLASWARAHLEHSKVDYKHISSQSFTFTDRYIFTDLSGMDGSFFAHRTEHEP